MLGEQAPPAPFIPAPKTRRGLDTSSVWEVTLPLPLRFSLEACKLNWRENADLYSCTYAWDFTEN